MTAIKGVIYGTFTVLPPIIDFTEGKWCPTVLLRSNFLPQNAPDFGGKLTNWCFLDAQNVGLLNHSHSCEAR